MKSTDMLTTSTQKLRSLKTSSVFKRAGVKQSTSTSPEVRTSVDVSLQSVDLPEEMPDYDVAYTMFIQDEKYAYDHLSNLMEESERECKEAQKQYLFEIKILQDFQDALDKKKEEKLIVRSF